MSKSAEAFRTIGEVADELGVPKHVLRFWEGRFPQIRPMKRGGGRRYYRPEDMELLRGIRALLHAEGYTIKGVQKILREHGIDQVKHAARNAMAAEAAAAPSARKRGRKKVQPAAGEPLQLSLPGVVANGEAKPDARVPVSVQVLAAIRELEVARSILRGDPHSQSSESSAKKPRSGRP